MVLSFVVSKSPFGYFYELIFQNVTLTFLLFWNFKDLASLKDRPHMLEGHF